MLLELRYRRTRGHACDARSRPNAEAGHPTAARYVRSGTPRIGSRSSRTRRPWSGRWWCGSAPGNRCAPSRPGWPNLGWRRRGWRVQTVKGLLVSARNAGLGEHQGAIVAPAALPAIITPADRDRVLARMAARHRSGRRAPHTYFVVWDAALRTVRHDAVLPSPAPQPPELDRADPALRVPVRAGQGRLRPAHGGRARYRGGIAHARQRHLKESPQVRVGAARRRAPTSAAPARSRVIGIPAQALPASCQPRCRGIAPLHRDRALRVRGRSARRRRA
jgi:hypothetical protein